MSELEINIILGIIWLIGIFPAGFLAERYLKEPYEDENDHYLSSMVGLIWPIVLIIICLLVVCFGPIVALIVGFNKCIGILKDNKL